MYLKSEFKEVFLSKHLWVRNFRGNLFSWKPKGWGDAGDFAPWALIFENVYKWIKNQ